MRQEMRRGKNQFQHWQKHTEEYFLEISEARTEAIGYHFLFDTLLVNLFQGNKTLSRVSNRQQRTVRTQKMFESLAIREARSIVLLKAAFKLVLGLYLVIGLIAGYRAWFQVKSLELRSSTPLLWSGTAIETAVVSYARTPITIRLELTQGAHTETFNVQHVPKNEWAFFDPRPRHASLTAVLTGETLSRFEAGKARLRATAIGRPQLSRLPPPLVREVEVEIPAQ